MAGAWRKVVAEAQEATGFTGNVVQRTVDGIGAALRLDHRADFYTELGALADSGGFEAFLNHWWTQALADAAPDADAREQAIDFADVAVFSVLAGRRRSDVQPGRDRRHRHQGRSLLSYTITWATRAASEGLERLRARDGDAVKPLVKAINALARIPEPNPSSKLGTTNLANVPPAKNFPSTP
ncbi:hypothetical protein [Streptomyces muensis]|uniref:Uncharacterized protein n=1 Tax=Streptomyces muensis TaxID=1077944 RepID=A0A9X1Q1A3_STRM4|nr:hypothetical protein [Streptomyces muensis]MCF1595578.1 hypothetical protein [Streptomyces muensis]